MPDLYPTEQTRRHERSEDCWCHPTVIPAERADGTLGWIYGHHEEGMSPELQADRAVCLFEALELMRLTDPEDGYE